MRSVHASMLVDKRIDEVWSGVTKVESWQALTEAFAGWGSKFKFAVDHGATLGHGAEVVVTTPRGRHVMRWRVSSWTPPTGLELVSTEENRGSAAYHILLTFKLSKTDEDQTQVAVTLVILFLNRFTEVVSLVLPFRSLYTRRLKRGMQRLRAAI